MKLFKKLIPLFCITLSITFICTTAEARRKKEVVCPDGSFASNYSDCPAVEEDSGEGEDEEKYEYEEEWEPTKEYRRLYYSFGMAGHYFVKKNGIGINGTIGVYSCLEFRFLKFLSVGFDSFYGYINGKGTQYLSAFNPGIKIFPMMYKNPNFEPYFTIGGHAFDAAFGSSGSQRGKNGYGQGGFAGAGFKWFMGESRFGMEMLVRASFLWMDKPRPATGRAFTVPVFMMLGFAY